MNLTGAQILIQALLDQGCDTVFGYPGGAVLNIYDAIYEKQGRLRHITVSHEQGAAHAADGYCRATGRTGVVIATSGPGATNLITGLATAFHDSVPLVAVTGNVSTDLIGRDSFQEVDIVDISNPVVKHNYFVRDAGSIAGIVREAFEIANSGRKGPVLIDIPKDITAAVGRYEKLPPFRPRPYPVPPEQALDEAARLIAGSRRPLIYAGGGVTFSGAGEKLRTFAEKIQAPVCLSMMGLSSFPADSPLYLGMVGMHGSETANMAVGRCDLLITVGARFSDRVTGNRLRFAKDAVIIHLDIDQSEISKNIRVHLPLVGDAGFCLEELTRRVPRGTREGWTGMIREHRRVRGQSRSQSRPRPPGTPELPEAPSPEDSGPPPAPRDLVLAICEAAGRVDSAVSSSAKPGGKVPARRGTIVVTDVGQHQMTVAQHYPFTEPRTFLSSCGLGTMGYGMGAANGAALGRPDKNVVLITGDGSFHMNLNELAVSVSLNLPVKVFVFNNTVLGMVHQWQGLFYGDRYSATEIRRRTDFAALAGAFGARGFRINTAGQAAGVLEQVFAEPGPCVVDCRIDPCQGVYPMVPPGAGLDEIILARIENNDFHTGFKKGEKHGRKSAVNGGKRPVRRAEQSDHPLQQKGLPDCPAYGPAGPEPRLCPDHRRRG